MTSLHALDRTLRLIRELVSDDVSYTAITEKFQSFRVKCLADEPNLMSHSGQTAIVTFVSLVSRLGVQIQLDAPEVMLVGAQPPLSGSRLREGLIDLGQDLIPGSQIRSGETSDPDLLFVFGDTPCSASVVPSWRITGNSWEGMLSDLKVTGKPWKEEWPIGAMTAAVLAATEVFKAVVRALPLRDNIKARLVEPVQQVAWDFGNEFLPFPNINCGPLDIISAGAITQAVMFTLFRLPDFYADVRTLDNDKVDETNLNRSVMIRRSDIGQHKVKVLERYSTPQLKVIGIPQRFDLATAAEYLPLAPHVIVGVDDIPSRWGVQQATKGWLGVGGTSHFGTSTSSHEARQPCCGCLHPRDDTQIDDPIPTASFISFWAGLALAVRFLRHQIGIPYTQQQQHLWLVPMRMDNPNAAFWSPVATRSDCPVRCRS